MVPGLDTRLRSIAKAIEQVILPALPAQEKLAREQAEIAIGHLLVMEAQWPYITSIARLELQLMVALGETVLAELPDESKSGIAEAIQVASTAEGGDPLAMQAATSGISAAIEDILCGDVPVSDGITRVVLRHARAQSRIERVWFSASGISDVSGLPTIAQLLAEGGA